MNHEMYFDDKIGVLVMRIKGDFNFDDAIKSTEFIDKIEKEKGSYDVLVDLCQASPKLDKEVRQMLRKQAQRTAVGKFAMIVTNPVLRIFGKIATSTMKNSKFFKTQDEALAWLEEV